MSLAFVRERDFSMTAVGLRSSTVQCADGSTADLVGKVKVLMVLATPKGHRILTTFYVLEDLTCDIPFREDFLDEIAAFETYRDAFSMVDCGDDAAEVKGLVWFNTAESRPSRGLDALMPRSNLVMHTSRRQVLIHLNKVSCTESSVALIVCSIVRLRNITLELFRKSPRGSASLDELDAQELHRRELARHYIDDLPEEAKQMAEVEENEKIAIYEEIRTEHLVDRDLDPHRDAQCHHPSYTVGPFQTQYLLE